ncbi:hypothetical protein EDB81DRAFT_858786 [Dactylonectria macrodidyma]|uniref:Uncharacterized protein n=1 Tax=Dactylonectria macrodidyma TaxID=307937 RepID=A0A9P9EAX4_9HYPO|nr:hypothetical protein EDB81DRAFT_858786 [Dactylonectria macrodidyma]
MCTDNQLPQLGSTIRSSNNSPFPTTSWDDEPSSQDNIQLLRAIMKTESLEDALKTFTTPSPPNSSQQHTQPTLPKLSEDPDHRVSSQTPQSDGSSAVTEGYIDERKSQIADSIVFNVTQWLRSKFDACRKNAGYSTKPNNAKRKSTERDDGETDGDGEERHKEDRQGNDRPIKGDENPKQPKHRCGRCWQPFKDEQAYFNHQRIPEPCLLRKMEHVEGFDAAQERSLKSRKRTNPELSETQKWKRVFKILFPHVLEDDIPSPSYEYDQISQKEGNHQDSELDYLAQCEEYMVREVPQRLRQVLGRELDRDLNIVKESLRRKAGDWVKTLLEDAFRELRQNRRPDDPSQSVAVNDEKHGPTEGSGLPLVSAPQPHSSESSIPHFEGENSFDPFTILGETELAFGNGGLLQNLLQPEEGWDGASRKLSDSGYGSNSPT